MIYGMLLMPLWCVNNLISPDIVSSCGKGGLGGINSNDLIFQMLGQYHIPNMVRVLER